MKYWFDMDGTIADLYGVENWLDLLRASDPTPFREAKPLLNLSILARYLHKLQDRGHEIGIISWTSKDGSDTYNTQVTMAKIEWLNHHMPSVHWDYIKIVQYGTDKFEATKGGVLWDDDHGNRKNWREKGGTANNVGHILDDLKILVR